MYQKLAHLDSEYIIYSLRHSKVLVKKEQQIFNPKHNPCNQCCFCRPSFLPDPNDGSLYILGGKHKEGLMVKKAECVSVCMCVCLSGFTCQFSLDDNVVRINLQKLPFTIPELVQSAPCRSSDGILYTGETPVCVLVCVCVCECVRERERCRKISDLLYYPVLDSCQKDNDSYAKYCKYLTTSILFANWQVCLHVCVSVCVYVCTQR